MPGLCLSLCRVLKTLLVTCAVLGSAAIAEITPKLQYVPPGVANSDTPAQLNARPLSFDGPYLSGINSTVFEWWWFEAVAEDLKSSLTLIFFTTTGAAFPLSGNPSQDVTSVFVSGLLPNGTVYYNELPASGAVFASDGPLGRSVAGNFLGSGATFAGSPDLAEYVVTIDALATYGIEGNITLSSTAPPHYVCTDNLAAGQTLQVFPHIGWANAQPAARACGTMKIGDQTLEFTNALGYHDHNWGDQPFTSLIKSWYWGHATLGPYAIVWFDGINSDGEENVSAYIASDGQILLASCAPGSLKVRPVGGAATYPPTAGHGSRFHYLNIEMKLPDGKTFAAKAVPESGNIRAPPMYTRWLGSISGGVVGEAQYEGITAFEEFTIS